LIPKILDIPTLPVALGVIGYRGFLYYRSTGTRPFKKMKLNLTFTHHYFAFLFLILLTVALFLQDVLPMKKSLNFDV